MIEKYHFFKDIICTRIYDLPDKAYQTKLNANQRLPPEKNSLNNQML